MDEASVDPLPLQEPLGFGFSAGGMLFPYYIGVIQSLHELGYVRQGSPLAGASAGALIAAAFNAGVPLKVIEAQTAALFKECRKNGTRFRIRRQISHAIDQMMPEDAYLKCRGTTFISVTYVAAGGPASGELITDFRSNEDLKSAVLTSCHCPVWFDGFPTGKFRGRWSYDGAIHQFIPAPPTAPRVVRVCCMSKGGDPPVSQRAREFQEKFPGIQISNEHVHPKDLLQWVLAPADEGSIEWLKAAGRHDVEAWAAAHTPGVPLGVANDQYDPGYAARAMANMSDDGGGYDGGGDGDVDGDGNSGGDDGRAEVGAATPVVCDDLDARWFGGASRSTSEAAGSGRDGSGNRGGTKSNGGGGAKGMVDDLLKLAFFSGFVLYTDVMGAVGRRKQLLRRHLDTDTLTSEGYWARSRY